MSTEESLNGSSAPSAELAGSGEQPEHSGSSGANMARQFLGGQFLGLSPVTWALLASAAGMQYFGNSTAEPVKERAEKTETQRAQENAGMNVEFLGQIKTNEQN